ncbi:MAG: DUF222 domain-containing protein [Gammaproteobacteria bacterium]|nr:DUF222 domain-containing protein [Gammaproteobacteria bacterium]MDE0256849.1 DUF222 domain-containing protein [Gammaproteobacteria bacterium]
MSTAAPAPAALAPVPSSPTRSPSGQPAASALVPPAPASVTPISRGLRPDLDPLGDEIALLCAHITAATYRLLCLLRVYEEEERWQGFRSCAHWLSWRTGISLGPAREKMRVARCLPSLSLIPEAFAKGELSYSKVRALTRIANPENEEKLLDFARHGTTAHVERMVRHWRRLDRGDSSEVARAERRGLSVWLTDEGSYEVRGRLNPEVGALLVKALEVAEGRLYRAERSAETEHLTTPVQRRADTLGLWLEERVQPQVQLVVHSFKGEQHQERKEHQEHQKREEQEQEVSALLVTEEGCGVSAETSSRLACDAEVVPIARADDGSVLDVGRRRRTVGWRLRKALEARDGGCRFPGCDSRARTHAHHITPWAEGGETAMNNLVLVCPFHHRAAHEGGWRVEMGEWGVPRFLNPLRTPVPVVPASPDIGGLVPRDAARARPMSSRAFPVSSTPDFGLGRWHGQDGIDAWTGDSLWTGERIDWGYAMLCLWGDGSEGGHTSQQVSSAAAS